MACGDGHDLKFILFRVSDYKPVKISKPDMPQRPPPPRVEGRKGRT